MEANKTATPNFIRIGHPAYTGTNRAQWTNSKSKAIEILRERGAKRNDAREAVNRAMQSNSGCSGCNLAAGSTGYDLVELFVFDIQYMKNVGML